MKIIVISTAKTMVTTGAASALLENDSPFSLIGFFVRDRFEIGNDRPLKKNP